MTQALALRAPAVRVQPAAVPRQPGFHLLVEALARTAGAAAPAVVDLPILEVPARVTHLSPAREPLALSSRKPRTSALVLEPLPASEQRDGRPRLLLLTPAGLRARLNGQAVPPVALLKVGDQLLLDARAILHVTEFRGAGAARPSPAIVGRPCGLCRLPLLATSTVYVCTCGIPLHLEGAPTPESERLECALFGCPSCGSEVRTESGHVWLPEL